MPTLSYSQLEQVWIQAGGSPGMAPLMAAIAEAESGGRYGEVSSINNNPSTGDYSVGPWQINYFGGLLQERTARYGSPQQLNNDPVANAKAAVDLARNGSGLSNWTTYTSGAYQSHLRGSVPPSVGQIPTGSGATSVTSIHPGQADAFLTGFSWNPISDISSLVSGVGHIWSDIFNTTFGLFTGHGGPIKTIQDGLKLIGEALSAIGAVFSALLWFVNPSNMLRVLAGFIGFIIAAFAIYLVATT